MVVSGLAALHFVYVASCYFVFDCDICHSMPVVGHFGPNLLFTMICKVVRSSSTLMIWLIDSNLAKMLKNKQNHV